MISVSIFIVTFVVVIAILVINVGFNVTYSNYNDRKFAFVIGRCSSDFGLEGAS